MTTKRNLFGRLVPCRCLRGEEEAVTVLDYSHCSLEQVPKEIFPFDKTLEELYLDANQIEELPKQLFNCQSLHKLSMPDNDLSVLPASISNLINLRELDVSKNGIQEFPENIKNCKVLSVVEASVNPISKLPDGFTQLLSLTQLYLNDAFLEFLPANFGRLTKLEILELRENQLKMLPKTMSRLTQLERLDLGSNDFTDVPEVLEQLSGLKELWMDGNRLAVLPGFIGKLKQLTYLDISKNNLEMIDDSISGCENLQDLLLSSNVLQQLPDSIGSLKKLTTLKVDENQLITLPDSIGGLSCLEELDFSFNEIEALPPTIGQLQNQRTLAADHNFITDLPSEIGNCKNVTVLFLHSNKLEYLPEEMGEMQKLKVINLSDNRLKNLPFTFTKLNELTAMWLSENQSKPLIPLQKEVDADTQKQVLTNYMFPQQPRTEDALFISDNESFNPSLWEEQRKQRAQVAFECDEDKDEREAPPREGNLKRYPTPYPDELKNMVKTAQSVVHRLKDDGNSDDSAPEMKPIDDRSVTTKNSAEVKDNAVEFNKSSENMELNMVENCISKTPEQELSSNVKDVQINAVVDDSEVINKPTNDILEDSENTTSDEEMKVAELRPPLIEIPITQPKVVALSKEKRDDADSLLEDIIPNSNQNNSNCSTPSRISDTVSFNTGSSQETLQSTPDRDLKTTVPVLKRNNRCDAPEISLLQNGAKTSTPLESSMRSLERIDTPVENKEAIKSSEFELNAEEKLALLEKGIDLNNSAQQYQKLLKIGMNENELAAEGLILGSGGVTKTNSSVDGMFIAEPSENTSESSAKVTEHLKNGNEIPIPFPQYQINGCTEEAKSPQPHIEHGKQYSPGLYSGGDAALSRSTEELSPQRECPRGPVVKSHSITNIETGGLKIYDIINDNGPHEQCLMAKGPPGAGQGQNITRSKSASLLSEQSLQPFTGNSASSSDIMSSKKAVYTFDQNFNPQGISLKRGPMAISQMPPVPQYNVQYSSSALPKENMWPQRPAFHTEQGSAVSQHHLRSETLDNANYVKHSANMNFSNRNNSQSSIPNYNMQQRMGPRQMEMWGCPPNERLIQTNQRTTLQRQSSVSSNSSVTLPETLHCRRFPVPEADYMTYRDLHTLGRGPPMAQGSQRPLSARTYSVDGPSAARPQSARPPVPEAPERTMSISDFNYSRTSPTKRPNMRVKSEHSLLDVQGINKVPPDWREQVLRHIEAKKLEKSMLSRSFNFNCAAFSSMHSGSCRELHDSQGNLALSVADGRNSGVHIFRYPSQGNSIGDPSLDDVFSIGLQNYSPGTVSMKDIPPDNIRKVPLTNGQMYQPSRVPVNCNQPNHTMSQATVGRHPSREQLIDYLMLKVSHQPPYTQGASTNHLMRQCRDIVQQEMHIKIDKNPELGFSISGGIGGRGNPFRPDDTGIFVTRVQPEGPASKLLQPGDKIVQANGYNFVNIEHGQAVSLLKTFQNAVDLIILREVAS